MMAARQSPIRVFVAYAHEDERLLKELDENLATLEREGTIDVWHAGKLVPGEEWEPEIEAQLEAAYIILLLVSPSFLASQYAQEQEMKRALERHREGTARVIPIILRPCDWRATELARLQALPRPADRPVVNWASRDMAWLTVVQGIRSVIAESPPPIPVREILQPWELGVPVERYVFRDRRPAWSELLTSFLPAKRPHEARAPSAFVSSLPLMGWGRVLAYRIAEALIDDVQRPAVWQISLMPEEVTDDVSSLLQKVKLRPRDIRRPSVLLVRLLGCHHMSEVTQLPRAVGRALSSGEARHPLSLIVLGCAGAGEAAELTASGFDIYHVEPPRVTREIVTFDTPFELLGKPYPMHTLLKRPECHAWYEHAETVARKDLHYAPTQVPSDRGRWHITFRALHHFVLDELEGRYGDQAEGALQEIAAAWTSLLVEPESSRHEEHRATLLRSGLFVRPELDQHSGVAPIAGAFGALCLALFLSRPPHSSQKERLVVDHVLHTARSGRRRPPARRATPQEVTAWLALVIAAYLGYAAFVDRLTDQVARLDLSIALDIHALRREEGAGTTLVHRLFMYIHTCQSAVPFVFRASFDRAFEPAEASMSAIAGRNPEQTARDLLEAIRDPDLLTTLLIAAAVRTKSVLDNKMLWQNVVPEEMRAGLRRLRSQLDLLPIEPQAPARITKRVLLLEDLLPIFPHCDRDYRWNDQVIRVPWLTAYVISRGCGTRLPHLAELQTAYKNADLQQAALDDVENPIKAREPMDRSEWVEPAPDPENQSSLSGAEFRQSDPTFLVYRAPQKVLIYRSAVDHIPPIISESNPAPTIPRPGGRGLHEALAAVRLVVSPADTRDLRHPAQHVPYRHPTPAAQEAS